MKAGAIKITTQNAVGKLAQMEYTNADVKTDRDWLLVTCDDGTPGAAPVRLLCRVPLANIVQILEPLPEQAS